MAYASQKLSNNRDQMGYITRFALRRDCLEGDGRDGAQGEEERGGGDLRGGQGTTGIANNAGVRSADRGRRAGGRGGSGGDRDTAGGGGSGGFDDKAIMTTCVSLIRYQHRILTGTDVVPASALRAAEDEASAVEEAATEEEEPAMHEVSLPAFTVICVMTRD